MGVAYDPSNGYIYVADSGSDSVSVINGATNTVIATITVGNGHGGLRMIHLTVTFTLPMLV